MSSDNVYPLALADAVTYLPEVKEFFAKVNSASADPVLAGIMSDLELGFVTPVETLKRLIDGGYLSDEAALGAFIRGGISEITGE